MNDSPISSFADPGAQHSIEWLMSRVAHCTCSRLKDVLDRKKNGEPGAKRTAYFWELVTENLTGQPAQHYENAAMQHGTENEPFGRMAVEAATGLIVDEVGFITHPTIPLFGGSPDGTIGDDGGLEIKAPFNSANHLQCFLTGMPEEHLPQIAGLMLVTGRQWWLFASFDPRMPDGLKLYTQRIERDAKVLIPLAAEVTLFLAEVAAQVAALRVMIGGPA